MRVVYALLLPFGLVCIMIARSWCGGPRRIPSTRLTPIKLPSRQPPMQSTQPLRLLDHPVERAPPQALASSKMETRFTTPSPRASKPAAALRPDSIITTSPHCGDWTGSASISGSKTCRVLWPGGNVTGPVTVSAGLPNATAAHWIEHAVCKGIPGVYRGCAPVEESSSRITSPYPGPRAVTKFTYDWIRSSNVRQDSGFIYSRPPSVETVDSLAIANLTRRMRAETFKPIHWTELNHRLMDTRRPLQPILAHLRGLAPKGNTIADFAFQDSLPPANRSYPSDWSTLTNVQHSKNADTAAATRKTCIAEVLRTFQQKVGNDYEAMSQHVLDLQSVGGGVAFDTGHQHIFQLALEGVKRWTFVPPTYETRLSTVEGFNNPHLGLAMGNVRQLRRLPKHALENAGIPHIIFDVHPGDLIYIPWCWSHATESLQQTAAFAV
eukprot:NODE_2064_length_1523_cov_56.843571_g1966_i0.p1 GENE.NODE_2064_length_1523_cov_56.843571_g1966_i0~~NODE_2064_length_1523_cov_56.843571_g1966_i0.p1  ORF type:complete len:438 (+),score=24.56 NODE_2064_length_1523_cov_56.843571_g1966_i0:100-1413(+)